MILYDRRLRTPSALRNFRLKRTAAAGDDEQQHNQEQPEQKSGDLPQMRPASALPNPAAAADHHQQQPQQQPAQRTTDIFDDGKFAFRLCCAHVLDDFSVAPSYSMRLEQLSREAEGGSGDVLELLQRQREERLRPNSARTTASGDGTSSRVTSARRRPLSAFTNASHQLFDAPPDITFVRSKNNDNERRPTSNSKGYVPPGATWNNLVETDDVFTNDDDDGDDGDEYDAFEAIVSAHNSKNNKQQQQQEKKATTSALVVPSLRFSDEFSRAIGSDRPLSSDFACHNTINNSSSNTNLQGAKAASTVSLETQRRRREASLIITPRKPTEFRSNAARVRNAKLISQRPLSAGSVSNGSFSSNGRSSSAAALTTSMIYLAATSKLDEAATAEEAELAQAEEQRVAKENDLLQQIRNRGLSRGRHLGYSDVLSALQVESAKYNFSLTVQSHTNKKPLRFGKHYRKAADSPPPSPAREKRSLSPAEQQHHSAVFLTGEEREREQHEEVLPLPRTIFDDRPDVILVPRDCVLEGVKVPLCAKKQPPTPGTSSSASCTPRAVTPVLASDAHDGSTRTPRRTAPSSSVLPIKHGTSHSTSRANNATTTTVETTKAAAQPRILIPAPPPPPPQLSSHPIRGSALKASATTATTVASSLTSLPSPMSASTVLSATSGLSAAAAVLTAPSPTSSVAASSLSKTTMQQQQQNRWLPDGVALSSKIIYNRKTAAVFHAAAAVATLTKSPRKQQQLQKQHQPPKSTGKTEQQQPKASSTALSSFELRGSRAVSARPQTPFDSLPHSARF